MGRLTSRRTSYSYLGCFRGLLSTVARSLGQVRGDLRLCYHSRTRNFTPRPYHLSETSKFIPRSWELHDSIPLATSYVAAHPCRRIDPTVSIKSSPAYPTIKTTSAQPTVIRPQIAGQKKEKFDHQLAQAAICRCDVVALSWRQVLTGSSLTGQSLAIEL